MSDSSPNDRRFHAAVSFSMAEVSDADFSEAKSSSQAYCSLALP